MPKKSIPPWYHSLLSPWAILVSIAAGVLIAVYFKELIPFVAPIGKIYLALLQMCVIPIILTAVTSSLGKLFRQGEVRKIAKRLVVVFTVALLFAGLMGTMTGVLLKPGTNIDDESRTILGQKLAEYESSAPEENMDNANEESGIAYFINTMVPQNIFEALTNGQNLGILFFAALLGVAIGICDSHYSEMTIGIIDNLYDAFSRMIEWFMYGLPLGLACLLAEQISGIGFTVLMATANFILLVYILIFVMLVIYSLIIWRTTNISYLDSLNALKKTMIVAVGTARPMAAIPPALSGLSNELNCDKKSLGLVVPLSFNTVSHGNVLYFALSSTFFAQLYGIELGLEQFIIIVIGSILASFAAAGAPGILAISMIGLVLMPLHLPVAASIILLIVIDPLIDNFLTMVTVYGNCACSALVTHKSKVSSDERTAVLQEVQRKKEEC